MDDFKGRLVRSVKGRDQGHCYVVIEELDAYFVRVADGRKKTVASPKRKNRIHLRPEGPMEPMSLAFSDEQRADEAIRTFINTHAKEV
ncbi:hypothetical protein ABB02_01023 [Clostridiaceae bacterium JG1575]|nr:hypothetical protein ABB02_01023 [Clostridiaceae bacterium JG1575]